MTDNDLPDILGEDLGYLLGWVALGETLGDGDGEEAARAMGAAIVGCEEMQAIRLVLRRQGIWQAAAIPRSSRHDEARRASARDVLRLLGLPDVVVEWVMS